MNEGLLFLYKIGIMILAMVTFSMVMYLLGEIVDISVASKMIMLSAYILLMLLFIGV